jgi:single-strand DNA-binding protein
VWSDILDEAIWVVADDLGTLPEEPQLTYSENGTPQCSFTLLVEEKGQEHTLLLYIPIDLFGNRAEKAAEVVSAGDTVLVDGKLRWRSWFDKKGEKQGKLAVLAWNVEKA